LHSKLKSVQVVYEARTVGKEEKKKWLREGMMWRRRDRKRTNLRREGDEIKEM
jgi:hypothetical protein